jgi:hypothetical protein
MIDARVLLFLLLVATGIPADDTLSADHWKILESIDTLELSMNGQIAGTLIQSTRVDDDSRAIRIDRHLEVGTNAASGGTAPGMDLTERREYGLDGMLKEAYQELKSNSGSSVWRLSHQKSGWTLAVTAGGVERTLPVASVAENLHMTLALLRGIRRHCVKTGDRFLDTAFELTSGQTITTAVRCTETPLKTNGFTWRFSCKNSVLDREEAWQFDTSGATLYQEIFPFVAIKKSASMVRDTKGKPFSLFSLIEALAVPVSRPPAAKETICLTFDGPLEPDSSVKRFYCRSGRTWLLANIPQKCLTAGRAASGAPDLTGFTAATTTMQSNDRQIRHIADSLCKEKKDRCDSIKACYEFVFNTIEKRYAPTFSNALETLKAGYGDCGEHAVLLGALLRSTGIPARVALGLVYVNERKGYYYHAWVMAESHGAWVFADPALGVFPAIKDRIPLVIDDTGSEVIKIAKMIGKIKIGYEKGR